MAWTGEADDIPAALNDLTGRVIGCAIEAHRNLGPGLLERLYEDALCYELGKAGIGFARQVEARVPYKEILLSEMRFDLVVEASIIVELKSIEKVHDVHLAQLVSYLRGSGLTVGLLINFNVSKLLHGVHRRVNTNRVEYARPIELNQPNSTPHSSSALSATSAFKL